MAFTDDDRKLLKEVRDALVVDGAVYGPDYPSLVNMVADCRTELLPEGKKKAGSIWRKLTEIGNKVGR